MGMSLNCLFETMVVCTLLIGPVLSSYRFGTSLMAGMGQGLVLYIAYKKERNYMMIPLKYTNPLMYRRSASNALGLLCF